MRLFRHLVSWALALFLIAMFVQATIHPLPNPPAGSVKFFDPPGENIIFQTIAERSGLTLFEPAGRVMTGLLELVAALFLLLPMTRRFGAILSTIVLGGAVAFHLSPWLGREVPISLDPASTATDGGSLFMLAILMLVASLLVLVVHPGARGRT
ncbi:DoxX family protein [Hyphomonas johnsonii]|jgi:uncharacterized membrane protein YphA (DoxX/SURF4 family)|uniref:DoxX family protein n=1 Tax=Hyphomonas johnsonii MHS-2 TaxID=1280950 RepID=A0A059FSS1_9PROT|nr:DoxX family protein [Hyphomonas johnsonii]KCZ93724.1 hypothetical protein HJO_00070 [Hyphomonas johnsonii MHS-2]